MNQQITTRSKVKTKKEYNTRANLAFKIMGLYANNSKITLSSVNDVICETPIFIFGFSHFALETSVSDLSFISDDDVFVENDRR